MGYRYDDAGNLCCDRCGKSGGVRKRKCPYKVLGHSLNGPAAVAALLPPAGPVWGLLHGHGRQNRCTRECRAAAVAGQAADDEIERQLDAGESLPVEAFGDWEPTVPNGMAGLKFVSRTGVFYRLMPEADYPNRRVALSANRTEPWTEHP
jgi:hypothetical protein